jgi:hypothetical protein
VGERGLAQLDQFNASYEQQFPSRVKPVRTTVGCDLVAGMRVEVKSSPGGQAGRRPLSPPASR